MQYTFSFQLSSRFTGHVICDYVFGLDAKAFTETSEFLTNSFSLFKKTKLHHVHKSLVAIFSFFGALFPYTLFNTRGIEWFIEFTKYALNLRTSNNIQRADGLDFLLKLQQKHNLNLNDIAGHAFTIFLDGFETTAIILAQTLYLLAKNPECQDKLREELSEFDKLEFDHFTQMPYLDNVINGNLN